MVPKIVVDVKVKNHNYNYVVACLIHQEMFINTVTKTLERKNSKEQEVQSGWFTTEEMSHSLGWSKILV